MIAKVKDDEAHHDIFKYLGEIMYTSPNEVVVYTSTIMLLQDHNDSTTFVNDFCDH